MRSLEFRPATTKELATSTVWNAKVFFASTPTAWRMDWSNIIRKRAGCSRRPLSGRCARVSKISVALRRAKRLQFADSRADIVECDLVAEIGCAYFRRDNESDFSALEFFVELHRAYDSIPWKILRQTRRQIESPQHVCYHIALSGRESGSFN